MNDKFILTGKIVNTHGVRGEVKIESWADSPEFFTKFKTLYIDEKPYTVLRSRVHKNMVISQLDGVATMNDAEALKGKEISVLRDDVKLPKGKYFVNDLVGLTAVDESGNELGKVSEILDLPGGTVAVINGEREILVPVRPEFILSHDDAKITVRLIEGM